ncbi:hypothetical protein [Desertivirga brevis]|uniref:hypothetical protein n=1 Tax=Desertivirga brevis TaxID=2810310 RepID=UPI001A963C9B|nr:hypothetical protein [Pedobacter sp. SYSU D00873]
MKNLIFIFSLLLALTACEQDEYYIDGGKAVAEFDGDVLQYLESKPVQFDTIAQIVKLAGLESTFRNENFTFFAPNDTWIRDLIGTRISPLGDTIYLSLNGRLKDLNLEPVRKLSDIDSVIWRKYLQRHMFREAYKLKDYPQIDFNQKNMFPGQLFHSFDKSLFNIGVEYGEANGIKYLGYRQLTISYVPDASRPDDNWRTVRTSSTDIQPRNGIVHTLRNEEWFGFDANEFIQEVALSRNNTNSAN